MSFATILKRGARSGVRHTTSTKGRYRPPWMSFSQEMAIPLLALSPSPISAVEVSTQR